MIVCPYNPCVLLVDIHDALYCMACPDCRLFSSLYPGSESIFTEEDVEK